MNSMHKNWMYKGHLHALYTIGHGVFLNCLPHRSWIKAFGVYLQHNIPFRLSWKQWWKTWSWETLMSPLTRKPRSLERSGLMTWIWKRRKKRSLQRHRFKHTPYNLKYIYICSTIVVSIWGMSFGGCPLNIQDQKNVFDSIQYIWGQ